MPFEKGISGNPTGRPKGSINQSTQQLRESIIDFLEANFEGVQSDFKSLTPKERLKVYCDLLQYGLPKLQAVQLEGEFDRLPDDQLEAIIQSLKGSIDE